MAEQQTTPTFKLVLVGDGGTGKASLSISRGFYSPYSYYSIFNIFGLLMSFRRALSFCCFASDHQQLRQNPASRRFLIVNKNVN